MRPVSTPGSASHQDKTFYADDLYQELTASTRIFFPFTFFFLILFNSICIFILVCSMDIFNILFDNRFCL